MGLHCALSFARSEIKKIAVDRCVMVIMVFKNHWHTLFVESVEMDSVRFPGPAKLFVFMRKGFVVLQSISGPEK